MQVVEAGTHLVDQRRRKCVGVTQGALLGIGGLRTLLESAAVRHAAEDARDELRIVHEAEPEEEIILLI